MAFHDGDGGNRSTEDVRECAATLGKIANTQAEMMRSVETLVTSMTRLTEMMVRNQIRDRERPLRDLHGQLNRDDYSDEEIIDMVSHNHGVGRDGGRRNGGEQEDNHGGFKMIFHLLMVSYT